MKKWERPQLNDLNYKFTKDQPTPPGCYCSDSGNNHRHGAPGQKDCPCCGTVNPS